MTSQAGTIVRRCYRGPTALKGVCAVVTHGSRWRRLHHGMFSARLADGSLAFVWLGEMGVYIADGQVWRPSGERGTDALLRTCTRLAVEARARAEEQAREVWR